MKRTQEKGQCEECKSVNMPTQMGEVLSAGDTFHQPLPELACLRRGPVLLSLVYDRNPAVSQETAQV